TFSQALVWPAREAFASESQAGLGSKLGIRQGLRSFKVGMRRVKFALEVPFYRAIISTKGRKRRELKKWEQKVAAGRLYGKL
ncbi:hypothetical protein V3F56_09525, partial [Moorellaceae bacterium AZ2]